MSNTKTEFAGIGPTGRLPYAVSAGQTTLARAPGFICCSAFVGNKNAFPNITVKKIPSAILKKCEWGREGYPLNLSKYTPKDEEFEFDEGE